MDATYLFITFKVFRFKAASFFEYNTDTVDVYAHVGIHCIYSRCVRTCGNTIQIQ